MDNPINILGFAGSLRKESYNRALLRAAVDLAPKDATLEIFDLDGIPPFSQDLEQSVPGKVREFKSKIKSADAILMGHPNTTTRYRVFSKMQSTGYLGLMAITPWRANRWR